MKKILAIAVGMLLIPFTAFGMEAMSDSDMDSITGQSGVAISLDNINVYQYEESEEFWYQAGTGAIGLVRDSGNASMLYLNVIESFDGTGATSASLGAYDGAFLQDTAYITGGFWTGPQVLSITIADYKGAITAVQIGLPTLEIFQEQDQGDAMQILLSAEDTNTPIADPAAQSFGTIWTSTGDNSTTTILNGALWIMPKSSADAAGLTYTP